MEKDGEGKGVKRLAEPTVRQSGGTGREGLEEPLSAARVSLALSTLAILPMYYGAV